jgi:hypothetical protein
MLIPVKSTERMRERRLLQWYISLHEIGFRQRLVKVDGYAVPLSGREALRGAGK